MPDRITVILTEPPDRSLPLDFQGVGLRRRAIELMSEVAEIKESSVRYDGARDDTVINFGDCGLVTLWQHDLIGAMFRADGKVSHSVCGDVVTGDVRSRNVAVVSFVRNEFD